jgi:hypothetical protein
MFIGNAYEVSFECIAKSHSGRHIEAFSLLLILSCLTSVSRNAGRETVALLCELLWDHESIRTVVYCNDRPIYD